MAEHAGDGAEAVVVWAVRNGLLGEWRRGLLLRLAAALRRSSSGASWGTTLTIPHTSSSSRASATAWLSGKRRSKRAISTRGARRKIRASPVAHFLSMY